MLQACTFIRACPASGLEVVSFANLTVPFLGTPIFITAGLHNSAAECATAQGTALVADILMILKIVSVVLGSKAHPAGHQEEAEQSFKNYHFT